MYRENRKHLQPSLLSDIAMMSEAQRERLEQSWAGAFREYCFKQIDESVFAVLYTDVPSRPNVPVNVLVSLEILKSGFGWSDEEMYEAFLFNMQVRYAVGYESLNDGTFAIRSLYHFRQRLSEYHAKHDVNLLERAFEGMVDEQIKRLNVGTKKLRMDSTQIASNIRDSSRLHLLVEGVRRLYRILDEDEKAAYTSLCEPYLEAEAKHYVYRLKGQEAVGGAIEQIGVVLAQLLTELKERYSTHAVYQTIQRLFDEHYRIQCDVEAAGQTGIVEMKANHEIGSGALQSLDDLEATFRHKAGESYQGYVNNISETCDDDNDLQLIVKTQVAPNNVDDAPLLAEALPDLAERTEVETLYTDGGYGSAQVDRLTNAYQVEQVQSAIRGRVPNPAKLTLADFEIEQDDQGRATHLTCPQEQRVAVEPGRTTGFLARFDPDICANCPLQLADRCRAKPQQRNPRFTLSFTQEEVFQAKRRQRHRAYRRSSHNPRAAVEATVRSVKHPFRHGKLPVRGRFRVSCMMIASAAMCNVRRIHRYLALKGLWLLIFAIFFAHRPRPASIPLPFPTTGRRRRFFGPSFRRLHCRQPITCFSC